ncbi:MAG: hypothetical protein QW620_06530 [Thermoplasmata archaeon]
MLIMIVIFILVVIPTVYYLIPPRDKYVESWRTSGTIEVVPQWVEYEPPFEPWKGWIYKNRTDIDVPMGKSDRINIAFGTQQNIQVNLSATKSKLGSDSPLHIVIFHDDSPVGGPSTEYPQINWTGVYTMEIYKHVNEPPPYKVGVFTHFCVDGEVNDTPENHVFTYTYTIVVESPVPDKTYFVIENWWLIASFALAAILVCVILLHKKEPQQPTDTSSYIPQEMMEEQLQITTCPYCGASISLPSEEVLYCPYCAAKLK